MKVDEAGQLFDEQLVGNVTGRMNVMSGSSSAAKVDPEGMLYVEQEVDGITGRMPVVAVNGGTECATASSNTITFSGVGKPENPLMAEVADGSIGAEQIADEYNASKANLVGGKIPASELPANVVLKSQLDAETSARQSGDTATLTSAKAYTDEKVEELVDSLVHDYGAFTTPAELTTAHPTANAGDMALVQSTDTVWVWSAGAGGWVDSDKKGEVTDAQFRAHTENTSMHVTATEKNSWNGKANEASSFTEAASRSNISSGDTVTTMWGKLRKWFTDLKAVAFSGSYNDLSDKPTSLPANGGNADTVDGKHATDFVAQNGGWLGWVDARGKSIVPSRYVGKGMAVEIVEAQQVGLPGNDLSYNLQTSSAWVDVTGGIIQMASSVRSPLPTTLYFRRATIDADTWTSWVDVQNADTVDGKHAEDFLAKTVYNHTGGMLVRFKWTSSINAMGIVRIYGNGYGAQLPINSIVQFYNYADEDRWMNYSAIHYGRLLGAINLFMYNGHIYLWLENMGAYETFKIHAESQHENINMVDTITNAAIPTTGVSRLIAVPAYKVTPTPV